MRIPYKPDGSVNFDQLEREYYWGYRGELTLLEWTAGVIAQALTDQLEQAMNEM